MSEMTSEEQREIQRALPEQECWKCGTFNRVTINVMDALVEIVKDERSCFVVALRLPEWRKGGWVPREERDRALRLRLTAAQAVIEAAREWHEAEKRESDDCESAHRTIDAKQGLRVAITAYDLLAAGNGEDRPT